MHAFAAGDDIKNMGNNLTTLATSCNADTNCRGFNNFGWLKRAVDPRTAANGFCLYAKNAPASKSAGQQTHKQSAVPVHALPPCHCYLLASLAGDFLELQTLF
jgi:hypothetical protein